ncbi:serine/threonine protein kinase [Thermomonas paludicola]|uniref:serine/threonine protein kinase n=1 Tax=Thermomonas paludicola TaxID=2884874 RepID=UPI002114F23A|nr:serine/threonine protein kinase [Thermomonas paludicola]
MDIIMELDDFKSAWQTLDQRLQLNNALKLHELRERTLARTRGSLRPIYWGQIAQILLIGVPAIVLAGALWMSKPAFVSVIVAGVALHLYGVLTIIAAGVVLGQLAKIDHAAPVVDIQKQLARTRTLYVRSGMIAGLPWWFLWVPILMALAGLGDVDLLQRAPLMVWGGLGVGMLGLMLTFQFHHWARKPERARFGRLMDDSLTGSSLRKAIAQLQEVQRFEQD